MKLNSQIIGSVIVLTSLLTSVDAHSATFNRFWRGYQRLDLSSEQFVAKVNEKIIPATRDLFQKPSGLLAYQPVISNMQAVSGSTLVANEFALLEYESEDIYRQFRATPEGIAYTDLHWEMFDKEQSKSAVVEPYIGNLELTHAYNLLGRDVNWKEAKSYFSIHLRNSKVSQAEFLASVKVYFDETQATAPDWGLQTAVILVMEDHIVVYEAWKNSTSRAEYEEALNADMPTGEISIRDTSTQVLDIELHGRSSPIWPGEGTKLVRP